MNVFIDECVTIQLLSHLTGHRFVHITRTIWRTLQNGILLRSVHEHFDVFLTTDRNIRYQQNLRKFSMAFVIMRGKSNRIEHLLPLVPDTLKVLDKLDRDGYQSGDFYEILPT